MPQKSKSTASHSETMLFENNSLLPMLYGENDATLKKLEKKLNVGMVSRGNMLAITGEQEAVNQARAVLENLYGALAAGEDVNKAEIDAAIRMETDPKKPSKNKTTTVPSLTIKTLRKEVKAYTPKQAEYIKALHDHDLVFALGPAGTGKTYIAVAMAVKKFINHEVDRIILSRPAVEAGEKLGFLPGDLKDKIDPYLRPLYDALFEMMSPEKVMRHIENGEIEVAPLAFMRGRTLSNAYIIMDEAQNSTATQMKMFLTRLGEGSQMAVTGDLSQMDLPRDVKSGLADATRKLDGVEGVEITRFADGDVVRHDLAAKIVHAYEEWDKVKRIRAEEARSKGD
ncbi:MAG: PhoH family protein [Rickettsiales bacterium]|nr:PhoH family protein [Rickettsiales bacterium]